MSDRSRAKALWVCAEGTYSTDPDSDGSDYLAVPAVEIGELEDQTAQIATNYFTGRPWGTRPTGGFRRWQLSFSVPAIGYTPCADDGQTVAAVDWLDSFLAMVGVAGTVAGEGCSGGSTSSAVMDTSIFAAQDVIPFYDGAWTIPKTQWAMITGTGSAPTYTLVPTLDYAIAATSESKGFRRYAATSTINSSTAALVLKEDSIEHTLLGGKITGLTLSADAGGMYRFNITMQGTTYSTTTKASSSLPAASTGPAVTPLKHSLSPIWFNGSKVPTKSVSIDFGMSTSIIQHGQNAYAAAGSEILMWAPKVTVEPLYTDAFHGYFNDPDSSGAYGRLLVQIGQGTLASDVLNTMCFSANQAHISALSKSDDGGRHRMSVTFDIIDSEYSTGVAADLFRITRA